MKKMREVVEVENAGLMALLGKKVLLFGTNYNYYGVLSGVNDDCVELTDPFMVFETGAFTSTHFSDAQRLPATAWCISKAALESFGEWK